MKWFFPPEITPIQLLLLLAVAILLLRHVSLDWLSHLCLLLLGVLIGSCRLRPHMEKAPLGEHFATE